MTWLDRRGALGFGVAALLAGCTRSAAPMRADPGPALAALEARSGGRLGACAIDTASGRRFGWRMDQRFAQCSAFKLSLAAFVLHGAQQGRWQLGERLRWSEADLLSNSPVTRLHVADGLTLEELARATLVTSDNAAANVLMRRLGGPEALTAFWRAMGDTVSRLDRYEPELNRVPPGSEMDTTTAAAMAATVARLVTGKVLAAGPRAKLIAWMAEVQTGTRRLRAGFPPDWVSGDKTGTGIVPPEATYVDVAYGGHAGRAPMIVAAWFVPASSGPTIDPAAEAVIAEIGRISAAALET